jgi:methionyl-tRNA formyltransferase
VSGVRNVFLGTPAFAVPVLRRLAASAHGPELVVTPPDRPRGRGRKLASPPVADAARELGLEVIQVASVNDAEALEAIRATRPELGVVCAFGQLIREPLISELEMLNVHPSLIPRWRGAAPIERAIMARDADTGVTIMRVTAGLDSGPVALQERVAIAPDDDYGSLAGRLAELAGEMILRALDLHREGGLSYVEQDDSLATYAEKISPGDRRLDPSRPAEQLEAKVRALRPHIGAYLELEGGERLGVHAARIAPANALEPGAIVAAEGSLVLGCVDGGLLLEAIQPPGGRSLAADAYLRGHPAPARAL